jgi:photosystem II stability/assembly factor-like uncharacterized protein
MTAGKYPSSEDRLVRPGRLVRPLMMGVDTSSLSGKDLVGHGLCRRRMNKCGEADAFLKRRGQDAPEMVQCAGTALRERHSLVGHPSGDVRRRGRKPLGPITRTMCDLLKVVLTVVGFHAMSTAQAADARTPAPFHRLPPMVPSLSAVERASATGVLFAVGDEGTLLRSVDDGRSWQLLNSGTSERLSVVAVSENGRLVLAVGENGRILRSEDGGEVWVRMDAGPLSYSGMWLNAVAMSGDGQIAVVAGGDGTFLESYDGGASWTVSPDVKAAAGQNDLRAVAIAADGKVAMAVGDNGTFVRSLDRGKTWTAISPSSRDLQVPSRDIAHVFKIAIASEGRTVLVSGENGLILRSPDSGSTWVRLRGLSERDIVDAVAMAPSGETVFAAIYNLRDTRVLRSADGGTTWTLAATPWDGRITGIVPPGDGRSAVAVGFGGTILRGANGDLDWALTTSDSTTDLSSIVLSPDGTVAVAHSASGLLRSTDGGKTWFAGPGSRPSWSGAVVMGGKGHIILDAATDQPSLRSIDSGDTWSRMATPEHLSPLPIALSPNGRILIAPSGVPGFLRSANGGESWTQVGSLGSFLSASFGADGRTIFAVGRNGEISRSRDTGETWDSRAGVTQSIFYAQKSADFRTIIAVGQNTGGPPHQSTLRSNDGGQAWAVSPGVDADALLTVRSHDGRSILAPSGWVKPLRRSADGGKTWIDVAESAYMIGSDAFMKFSSYALSPDGRTALAVGSGGSDAVDFGGVREPVEREAGIVFRSPDGGRTFAEADRSAKVPLRGVVFLSDRTAVAVGWNSFNFRQYSGVVPKSDLLRSADAGLTWTHLAVPSTAMLNAVAASDDGSVALAVGGKGIILRSVDDGWSWYAVPSGTEAELSSVLFVDNSVALSLGVGGTILRSRDAGLTWRSVASGVVADLVSVAQSTDSRIVLAVGATGTIRRSSDGGDTFVSVPAGTSASLSSVAMAQGAGIALIVGPRGLIMRSVDAGASWVEVPSGTADYLRSVAIADDGMTAAAVGDRAAILRGTDGGLSWLGPE